MSIERDSRPKTRRYEKRRRAELEQETRRRITEATVGLHGTVGPARTSISAVAERAGVRRATVYRHFPDERSLFAACSGYWMAANPPPDAGRWQAIADPDERLRTALAELYAYYGRTEDMLRNLIRDERSVAVLGESMAAFWQYLDAVRDLLLRGRPERGRRRARARAAIGHAVAFETWRSLVRAEGLDDRDAVKLMANMVVVASAASCETQG